MHIEILDKPITPAEFRHNYVEKNIPVLIKGYGKNWLSVEKWNTTYFKNRFGNAPIATKKFLKNGEILVKKELLNEYMNSLENYEQLVAEGLSPERPSYWHDVPIFQVFEDLIKDIEPFEPELLPAFYRKDWSKYIQFFMGSSGSVTKLHFDTLRTHNLFFQISGRKRWTILSTKEEHLCGRKQWRWFGIDPEAPDLARFPEYQNANPVSVMVDPGDLLYIPPGTLHHVRSLDTCISFNIDFHTPASVMNSFRYLHKGMPGKVIYYNVISFLGLVGKIPAKLLFPFYRSYLNYVS